MINALSSAGSFLDGGGSRPTQRNALPLVIPEHILAESRALKETFSLMRALLLQRLGGLAVMIQEARNR